MKKYVFFSFLFFYASVLFAQSVSLLTWNIRDLGRTKDDAEIAAIVSVLRNHDLVAIQEVVAKDPAGAQAVAKIADLLNRTGTKWDYIISDPSVSPSPQMSERYAFLWKTAKIKRLNDPFPDRLLEGKCVRPPYIGKFQIVKSGKTFFLVNVHARRFDQGPEEEIQYFSQYPERLKTASVIIAGDFNLDEKHRVWQALYDQGFHSALSASPTTLKQTCTAEGHYLNYSIDNIYFPAALFRLVRAGREDFVKTCENLETARGISDHLPVYVEVE
ncbi:MAG: endonuclease/exonuclease/phosphatase family protein [Bacteroidia bacterium]|nr:endonuclease/exonuclease/phosphatase family protein [Bacteroidia bacterium]